MTTKIPLHRARALGTLGALLGLSAALGACIPHATEITTTSSVDYRQRHPIAVTEADRSIVVFVGQGRGGLSDPRARPRDHHHLAFGHARLRGLANPKRA